MIKKYLMLIIAAALVLVGLIGTLVCVIPSTTDEFDIVNKYIEAVDDCDAEAMSECFWKSELLSYKGPDFDDDDLEEKIDYLKACGLDAYSRLPEGTETVIGIELIGCSQVDNDNEMNMMGIEFARVNAVVKVTYEDEEGAEQSLISNESVHLYGVDGELQIAYF